MLAVLIAYQEPYLGRGASSEQRRFRVDNWPYSYTANVYKQNTNKLIWKGVISANDRL